MNRELDGLPAFDAWNTDVGELQKSLPEGGVNPISGASIGCDAGALSFALDMVEGRNGRLGIGCQGQMSDDMSANSLAADFTLRFPAVAQGPGAACPGPVSHRRPGAPDVAGASAS